MVDREGDEFALDIGESGLRPLRSAGIGLEHNSSSSFNDESRVDHPSSCLVPSL